MRLIDADWMLGEIDHDLGCYEIEDVKDNNGLYVEIRDVVKMVCAAPTITPESLKPKGRWKDGYIDTGDGPIQEAFECNVCGKWQWRRSNYCPNCGAKMEG